MGVIGILGGRFDPPHVGHVALARAAVERFGIDELHVTVVVDAAHKPSVAPFEHRLAMARLAFAPLGAVVEPEEHRYTVDALEARGYERPVFLIGADQLADLPTWKEPERVLELARLGVATRPGYALDPGAAQVEPFTIPEHDVSSTAVRERVARGEPIDGLVPPEVAAYIGRHGVYGRD